MVTFDGGLGGYGDLVRDHAEAAVVEDDEFDRQSVGLEGRDVAEEYARISTNRESQTVVIPVSEVKMASSVALRSTAAASAAGRDVAPRSGG